jgi:putative transposase
MQPLQPDTSYHIFNHANGFENVFRKAENFRYFLEKYRKYISPIAETYAYCLMPNHFHLVVRMRKREVIEKLILKSSNSNPPSNSTNRSNPTFSKVLNFGKGEIIKKEEISINEKTIELFLSKQFANFFSCYTQSFNKLYKRMGSLFIKNFKREIIEDKQHFFNAVIYTHRNPVHHGFCSNFDEWDHSSFFEIVHAKSDMVEVEKLLKTFGGLQKFIEIHQQSLTNFMMMDQPEK